MDNFSYEEALLAQGKKYIVGVDEVGRGCLAGPVMAAAVILPFPCFIQGIKDSKKIAPKKREILCEQIQKEAIAFSFGLVSPAEIDEINILQATLKAMRQAVLGLSVKPDYILIDGRNLLELDIPQRSIIGGDNLSISIAAASILAKVERDALMRSQEEAYPGFSFSGHKGYGTAAHLQELRSFGATPIHRKSFKGVL